MMERRRWEGKKQEKDFILSLRAAGYYCLSGFPIKRYLFSASPRIVALLHSPPSPSNCPSPSAKCHPDTPASLVGTRHSAKAQRDFLVLAACLLHVQPPTGMKDLVSCFSEHAVRISDVACSGSAAVAAATAGRPAEGAAAGGSASAAMSGVTTVYRSRLSASGKDLLVDVTWSRSPDGPALSVAVHDAAAASRHHHHRGDSAAPRHLHRRKGSGTFTAGSCVVGVFWDYASARYDGARGGPEPVSGYYVAVVADAEFVLLLGDMSRGYVERLHGGIPVAASRMARRRERFVGCGSWSTRARFLDSGAEHEIGVGLDGDAEAWVAVDGRKVVQLRRLRWNFRGSHTLFLDGGAPVDITWDLHGWLFQPIDPSAASSSSAVFTFHARGASETKLWTDDGAVLTSGEQENEKPLSPAPARAKQQQNKEAAGAPPSGQGFCLLVQGFRSSSKIT